MPTDRGSLASKSDNTNPPIREPASPKVPASKQSPSMLLDHRLFVLDRTPVGIQSCTLRLNLFELLSFFQRRTIKG